MDIRLIIRADDFGMAHSCNQAIGDCFREGVLACAAIIAPGPWAQEAAAMAKANPQWCIGAHLATVGEWRGYRWRPVLPHGKVNTLTDEYGFLNQSPKAFFAKTIDYNQLEREFMAQIDLLSNGWGVNLGYVDFHYSNGLDYNAPEYSQVLQRVAKVHKLPLSGYMGEKRMRSIYNALPNQKTAEFTTGLDELEPGLWLSLHHLLRDDPEAHAIKYFDSTDEKEDSVAAHRTAEAAVLKDPAVRERIKARGIKLITYRDI